MGHHHTKPEQHFCISKDDFLIQYNSTYVISTYASFYFTDNA